MDLHSAFPPREIALLGRHTESALSNQPSLPPDANWAAQRELSRSNGERFLAPGYGCVLRAEWMSRYSATVLSNGAHFWYNGDDGLWWLGKISASTTTDGLYLVRFLCETGPIFLFLWRAAQLRRGLYEALGVYKYT